MDKLLSIFKKEQNIKIKGDSQCKLQLLINNQDHKDNQQVQIGDTISIKTEHPREIILIRVKDEMNQELTRQTTTYIQYTITSMDVLGPLKILINSTNNNQIIDITQIIMDKHTQDKVIKVMEEGGLQMELKIVQPVDRMVIFRICKNMLQIVDESITCTIHHYQWNEIDNNMIRIWLEQDGQDKASFIHMINRMGGDSSWILIEIPDTHQRNMLMLLFHLFTSHQSQPLTELNIDINEQIQINNDYTSKIDSIQILTQQARVVDQQDYWKLKGEKRKLQEEQDELGGIMGDLMAKQLFIDQERATEKREKVEGGRSELMKINRLILKDMKELKKEQNQYKQQLQYLNEQPQILEYKAQLQNLRE